MLGVGALRALPDVESQRNDIVRMFLWLLLVVGGAAFLLSASDCAPYPL